MTDVSSRSRVSAGVPTGGEFSREQKAENGDLAFDDSNLDPHCDELDALKPNYVSLYFVDYDEKLDDEQLNELFEGGYADVQMKFMDNARDAVDQRVDEEIGEWMTRAQEAGLTEREDYELDDQERESFRYAVEECDDSWPVDDLTDHTRAVLLRAPIADNLMALATDEDVAFPANQNEALDAVIPARMEILRKALAEKGLEVSDDNLRMLAGSYQQWHEGMRLDTVWCADARDVVPDHDPTNRTQVSVAHPNVVLMDAWQGSFEEAETVGTMKIDYPAREDYDGRFDADKVPFVDGTKHGYGVDQIAGVVKSAYRADTTRNTYLPDKVRNDSAQMMAMLAEDKPDALDVNVGKALSMGEKATPRIRHDAILMAGAWAGRTEAGPERSSRNGSTGAIVNGFLPKASREEASAVASRISALYGSNFSDSDAQRYRLPTESFQRSVMDEWSRATGNPYDPVRYDEAAHWKASQIVTEAVERWA